MGRCIPKVARINTVSHSGRQTLLWKESNKCALDHLAYVETSCTHWRPPRRLGAQRSARRWIFVLRFFGIDHLLFWQTWLLRDHWRSSFDSPFLDEHFSGKCSF